MEPVRGRHFHAATPKIRITGFVKSVLLMASSLIFYLNISQRFVQLESRHTADVRDTSATADTIWELKYRTYYTRNHS